MNLCSGPCRFVFSLLMLFAVVLIHVVMQMRRKELADAERKGNFPRVVITTLTTEVKRSDRSEMGWTDPTATQGEGEEAAEASVAAKKKEKEEEGEWARDQSQCADRIA